MEQAPPQENILQVLEPAPIDRLPDDILPEIFKFLSVSDLKNVRLVCIKWDFFSFYEWSDNVTLNVQRVNMRSKEEVIEYSRRQAYELKSLAADMFQNNFQDFVEQGPKVIGTANCFAEHPDGIFDPDGKIGIGVRNLYKNRRNFAAIGNLLSLRAYKLMDWNYFGLMNEHTRNFWNMRLLVPDSKSKNWFLAEFAPQMVEILHLENCAIFDYDFIFTIQKLLHLRELILTDTVFFRCPVAYSSIPSPLLHLKKFKLNFDNSQHSMLMQVNHWKLLLLAMPSLEEFKMKDLIAHRGFGDMTDILTAMTEIRDEYPTKLSLKSLDIIGLGAPNKPESGVGFLFPVELVELLEKAKFPLESLKLHIGCDNLEDEKFVTPRIIKVHAKTLKHLTIRRDLFAPFPQSDLYPFDDFKVESLKTLRLEGPFSRNSLFLKLTPKLEYFSVLSFREGILMQNNDDPSIRKRMACPLVEEGKQKLEAITGNKYLLSSTICEIVKEYKTLKLIR